MILTGCGLQCSYADYSLFTYSSHGIFLCVLLYIVDLITIGNNLLAITQFKSHLHRCFQMKYLGPLKYFLGIEVARNASGLYLTQRKYVLYIVSKTGLSGPKPASTHIEQNHQLATDKSGFLSVPERYRCLVYCLIYLTITRPELAYSVQTLAQFMQKPCLCHWEAALQLFNISKSCPTWYFSQLSEYPYFICLVQC